MERKTNIIKKTCSTWSFSDLTIKETQYLTHGYHRYPAKFIPQLVNNIITEYSSPKDIICDPFGGCGTTLVEARLTERTCVGFDINPLAVMITRTKINALNPETLSQKFQTICESIEAGLPSPPQNTYHHLNMERLKYWFGDTNLKEILMLKHYLKRENQPDIRRFFLCALSHVLKNCSYWLAKSTKPQKDPLKKPLSPFIEFPIHARYMTSRNRDFYEILQKRKNLPIIMHKANAKSLPLPDNSIDMIITSPPYSTSYDYPDIHQLSALLFGFCDSISDFRIGFIGNKFGHTNRQLDMTDDSLSSTTVNELRKHDTTLSVAVNQYFIDMLKVYQEMYRVIKTGGKACIVIGDSELRGIKIPNTEIAIQQLKDIGFKTKEVIKRKINSKNHTSYRNRENGRFSRSLNENSKEIYSHENIIVMQKL